MAEAGKEELVACPGCGKRVHRRATACAGCGYQAELSTARELLGSLSAVCSILVGFGLASLVTLATDDSGAMQGWPMRVAAALWVVASLLLLAVMLIAELLRRHEPAEVLMLIPRDQQERLAARCEWLLTVFAVSLGITGVGLICLGFHFSLWHGLVSVAAVVSAGLVGCWAWR